MVAFVVVGIVEVVIKVVVCVIVVTGGGFTILSSSEYSFPQPERAVQIRHVRAVMNESCFFICTPYMLKLIICRVLLSREEHHSIQGPSIPDQ